MKQAIRVPQKKKKTSKRTAARVKQHCGEVTTATGSNVWGGERDWYVTSVAMLLGGEGLVEATSGSKRKYNHHTIGKSGSLSDKQQVVIATLVSHRTVVAPRVLSESSSSSSGSAASSMFNEDSCKICVWNVHTQVAIREICFQPAIPAPRARHHWWTGMRLPNIKLCVTSCEFAKSHSLETSGESSPAPTKGASLGGKASVSPILCGQSLCGQTIELLVGCTRKSAVTKAAGAWSVGPSTE